MNMLVDVAINQIRDKINDRDEVGLDDNEILSYLNEAIQYISSFLVGAGSPLFLNDLTLTETETALPKEFVRTAGKFPIKITGSTIKTLDDPPVTIRYFANTKRVELDDDMPFQQMVLNQVCIKLAAIYCQNQQALDVSQDKALLNEINQAIAAAVNGPVTAANQPQG